jgi:hypothetical protein
MRTRRIILALLVSFMLALILGPMPAAAGDLRQELIGVWIGTYLREVHPDWAGSRILLEFLEQDGRLVVSIDMGSKDRSPVLHTVFVHGDSFTFRIPLLSRIDGQIVDGKLVGTFTPTALSPIAVHDGTWQAERYPIVPVLEMGPGPDCSHIPGPWCEGTEEYCGELVLFTPEVHEAWFNYPVNGETWDNQYRSYIRRDVMMLVQYASSMVHCRTAGWNYGNDAPMGLGDMSEADGAIPPTWYGGPAHPLGTHTNGFDIDVGYYQLYTDSNILREICDCRTRVADEDHCVGEPYALDPYRNALFIAHLAEHPRFRVIGVDGKVGPILELALDELVLKGWIDADLRATIPLSYEVEDIGWGWYYHHHHHMHISWKQQAGASMEASHSRPSRLSIVP